MIYGQTMFYDNIMIYNKICVRYGGTFYSRYCYLFPRIRNFTLFYHQSNILVYYYNMDAYRDNGYNFNIIQCTHRRTKSNQQIQMIFIRDMFF